MEKITKKQHWIPKFIVKKWANNKGQYKFYDNQNKKFNVGNLEKSKNDIFFREYLYENSELFEINEIEKGLSKIESAFAKILKQKIINKNHEVIINRLELKIIKLYWLIESYRSLTTTENAYNLRGTSAYNNYFSNKTKKEINEEFLKNLHYLVFDVFDYIKNNTGFLPKRLEIIWEKWLATEQPKFAKKDKSKVFESDNLLFSSIFNVNHSSCLKIIKINEKINYNFLLTDSRNVQFFGTSYSEIYGWPILELMSITPRYAIALLKLNILDHSQSDIFAKGSLWDKKFPGLFIVNQEWELNQQQKFLAELEKQLNDNPKIEENEWDLRCLERDLALKNSTNKDLYYYPIYELNTNEQVHLINAMLHSQTYKYVSYLKREDLSKAIETIKLHDIYRIEDFK